MIIEVRDEDGDLFAQWRNGVQPMVGDIIERPDGETVFVTARTVRSASAKLEIRAHRVDVGQDEDLSVLLEQAAARAEAAELELEGLKSGRIRTLEVHRLLEAIVTRQPGALGHAEIWTEEQKKRDARQKKS